MAGITLQYKSFYRNYDDFKECSFTEKEKIKKCLQTFKERSVQAVQKAELYAYIQEQACLAKEGNSIAVRILYHLFQQLMLKECWLLYIRHGSNYYPRYAFDDLWQDSYFIFIDMLDHYDENKSFFTYYIWKNFKKRVYSLMMRQLKYLQQTSVRLTGNGTIDFMYGHNDSFMNILTQINIINEIQKLLIQIKKKAKSETTRQVCDNIIFGQFSIRDLAKQNNVSYHAVYQIYESIQVVLANYINHSQFCDYAATLKSTHSWSLGRKDTTVKYNYIYKHICKACGHKFKISTASISEKHSCPSCGNETVLYEKQYARFSYFSLDEIQGDTQYETR